MKIYAVVLELMFATIRSDQKLEKLTAAVVNR